MHLLANIQGLTAPSIACGLACVGLLAHGTFVPQGTFWGPVVSRARSSCPPWVALTFDDGPTPGATDRILDTLGELDARATFFVVGQNARRWPDLVERMDAEGHLVANHTWDHARYGLFRRDDYWRQQVRRTDDLVERIIGRRPALFRPPMGAKTWHVMAAARGAGHTVVTWNRRASDATMTDSDRIVRRLTLPSGRGDILQLHDGVEPNAPGRDTRPTETAIKPLVTALRAKGLEPRRLDLMLDVEAYQQPSPYVARTAASDPPPLRRAA